MLLLAAVFGYVYQQRVEVDNARLRNATSVALHSAVLSIRFKLKEVLNDVRVLVELSAGSRFRPDSLKPLYRSLLKNRIGVYDQIRLLDRDGNELIRVNDENGRVQVVPDDQLQDKSDYYYFRQARTLNAGEILMSQFDLNVERGKVEVPYTPMLRFIAPVYVNDPEASGFVVINYLGTDLLQRIRKHLPDYTETLNQFWMLNDQGYWIQGPDPEKEWAFMFEDKRHLTVAYDYPDLWATVRTAPERGQMFLNRGLLTYVSVHAHRLFGRGENIVYSNPNERWFLVDYLTEPQLSLRRNGLSGDLLQAFIAIALVSSLLLWWTIRSMGQRWLEQQYEKLFIDVMERIPTGVFVLDNRGQPFYMNQTAAAIVGDKLAGDFDIDALPELCQVYREGSDRLYPPAELPIVKALQGETATAYDMEIKRAEQRIPIQVNATPIKDERGRITHAVAAFSDISRLKQQQARIREEETLHRALLDSSVDAIVTIDERGLIRRINPALETMFGYNGEELLGKNVNLLMPEPYRSQHDGYLRNFLETGRSKIIGVGREVEVRCKDGSLIPCDLTITEVKLPGKHLFKGILRDIRERKRIEQMQKEFIATVSHELRTPLTAISGSLKLLANELSGEANPLANELLEIAGTNAERLILLVNDILDIEKLAAGAMKFTLEAARWSDLVGRTVAANQSYAEQHGTRFELLENTGDADVVVDKDRFVQVLTNLLSNAAKFSPPGRPVKVLSERDGDLLRVTVADQGPGIPESFKEHLFKKFAQAEHADSQRKGGTGLGLYIAKSMIERMGGRIDYESEIGRGSRFYIEIPVYRGADAKPTLSNAGTGPRILVCEDDRDVAKLLTIMLEKSGFRADTASNAAELRKMLEGQDYAAMTLDLMLPDMHWPALFEELRRNDRTRHMPVIVVSAIAEEAKHEVSVGAINIFDWLSKPIDEHRLIRAVSEASASKTQSEPRANILYLDDDRAQARKIVALLQHRADVVVSRSVGDANRLLSERSFHLIIVSMNLPNISELSLHPEDDNGLRPIPVMVVSGENNAQKILFEVQQISRKSQYNDESLVATIQRLIRSNAK